jgi:hypothetical protein
MGAVRPQTPHRSPRQAFGGNFQYGLPAASLEKIKTTKLFSCMTTCLQICEICGPFTPSFRRHWGDRRDYLADGELHERGLRPELYHREHREHRVCSSCSAAAASALFAQAPATRFLNALAIPQCPRWLMMIEFAAANSRPVGTGVTDGIIPGVRRGSTKVASLEGSAGALGSELRSRPVGTG